jgi:surface antigen
MDAGNQCTNYAAYVESTVYRVARPNYNLGNGGDWATNARNHGVLVNAIPSVGSVAEWNAGDYGMGPDGHVAVVEQVGPNDSYIVVSQQNITSDTNGYDWEKINAGAPSNSWEPWPDNFIHFAGSGTPPLISVLQGGTLSAKEGSLRAGWTTEATGVSQDAVASDPTNGPLIGVLQGNTFSVKEGGLAAGWVKEATGVSQDAVASDPTNGPLIGVLQGNTFSVKEGGLTAGWVKEATGVSQIAVASDATNGPLIGVLQGNTFSVKEGGLTAGWVKEATGVSQIAVASDPTNGPLIGVLQGNTLAAKEGSLTAGWTTEATGVSQIAVAG